MNRRKFFGAIAAAVTAAMAPALPRAMEYRGTVTGRWSAKGPGFITGRYGSGNLLNEAAQWWRPNATLQVNYEEVEKRLLIAWKECLAYKTGDTLIIDEQAYEVFKTHRSKDL